MAGWCVQRNKNETKRWWWKLLRKNHSNRVSNTDPKLLRHTVVCRAAQENGVSVNGVSILTETTKSRYSRIHSSVMSYPNGTKCTVELASMQGRPHFKLWQDPLSCSWDMSQQIFIKIPSFFSFSFCTLCKHCYNWCMRALIWLNFGTYIGGLKENSSTNFGVNLINIERVKRDFIHKANANFFPAYRVNRFEEQA